MGNKIIKVNFIYESHPNISFECEQKQKLKDIFEEFASQNGINLNSIYFIINGQKLTESDFDKSLKEFITPKNKDELNIFVYDNEIENSENRDLLNLNQNGIIVFSYRSEFIEIKCSIKSKMVDVTNNLANQIGSNVNDLDFYYGNTKLNFGKTFDQLINKVDLKKGKMEIKVEEKKENKKIMEDNTNNNIQNEKESFCYKNKKIIIIISLIIIIILIIFIILLFTVILKKKEDEKEEEFIIQIDEETQDNEIIQSDSIEIKEESTEKCLEYDLTNKECLICNKKYDLYKGDCV